MGSQPGVWNTPPPLQLKLLYMYIHILKHFVMHFWTYNCQKKDCQNVSTGRMSNLGHLRNLTMGLLFTVVSSKLNKFHIIIQRKFVMLWCNYFAISMRKKGNKYFQTKDRFSLNKLTKSRPNYCVFIIICLYVIINETFVY